MGNEIVLTLKGVGKNFLTVMDGRTKVIVTLKLMDSNEFF